MKKSAAVLALVFLSSQVLALQLQSHLIEMEVDEGGKAKVIEKYTLLFLDTNEKILFKERAERNSSSILAWKADFEFFYPRFESQENRVLRSTVSYEQEKNTLLVEYELENPLMTLLEDKPRETRFNFSGKQLNAFIKEGLIVIPSNTLISITLPQRTQIAGEALPTQVEVNENKILIKPISTSHLTIEYIISKPISTRVNSLEIIREFFSNSSNVLIIVAALFAIGIIYWKKDKIEEKIENYIVEHSEIERGERDEEIELRV